MQTVPAAAADAGKAKSPAATGERDCTERSDRFRAEDSNIRGGYTAA